MDIIVAPCFSTSLGVMQLTIKVSEIFAPQKSHNQCNMQATSRFIFRILGQCVSVLVNKVSMHGPTNVSQIV